MDLIHPDPTHRDAWRFTMEDVQLFSEADLFTAYDRYTILESLRAGGMPRLFWRAAVAAIETACLNELALRGKTATRRRITEDRRWPLEEFAHSGSSER